MLYASSRMYALQLAEDQGLKISKKVRVHVVSRCLIETINDECADRSIFARRDHRRQAAGGSEPATKRRTKPWIRKTEKTRQVEGAIFQPPRLLSFHHLSSSVIKLSFGVARDSGILGLSL